MFDSFEVQLFSSAVGPLGDHFGASVTARDAVLAVWLVGILLGALLGGRLTDRFGRRRLFVATLIWYAGFTMLTGLAPTLGVVYLLRFAAALGVGAEYAIVSTGIAEFVPARVRGRANAAVMNFWPAGAILAALMAYVLLDVAALGAAVSWRYMFVLGGLLALVVLVFRRRIPESPRWLASRGRHSEADAVVSGLEAGGGQRCGPAQVPTSAPAPLPFRAALGELARYYPGRLALGALLDLAELQTSLDGAVATTHDRHRGAGSWARTLEGIRRLVELGLPPRVALTETPENTGEVPAVAELLEGLGVPAGNFAVRPMLRRGLSQAGLAIGQDSSIPELTVTADGLHWHPAGADTATSPDMHLAGPGTSLAEGKRLVIERFFRARLVDGSLPQPVHCAI